MADTQRVDQYRGDEVVGAQSGEAGVEMADIGQVDAVVGEQFELLAQRGQARRRRLRREELARVRLEGEHGRRQAGVRRHAVRRASSAR
jgi:ABC-type amino acid transport substrate-binding protein